MVNCSYYGAVIRNTSQNAGPILEEIFFLRTFKSFGMGNGFSVYWL